MNPIPNKVSRLLVDAGLGGLPENYEPGYSPSFGSQRIRAASQGWQSPGQRYFNLIVMYR